MESGFAWLSDLLWLRARKGTYPLATKKNVFCSGWTTIVGLFGEILAVEVRKMLGVVGWCDGAG